MKSIFLFSVLFMATGCLAMIQGCAEMKTDLKRLRDAVISRPAEEGKRQVPSKGVEEKKPGTPLQAPREEKGAVRRKAGAVFAHRVKYPGETLSIIAKWYTDDLENWKTLVETNPRLNPKRIVLGETIWIPERLLKTREPMPRAFLDDFLPKPHDAGPQEKIPPENHTDTGEEPPSRDDEEPELFGPKAYRRE